MTHTIHNCGVCAGTVPAAAKPVATHYGANKALDDAAQRLIDREVLACQSSLVSALMEQGLDGFSIDDCENNMPAQPGQYLFVIDLDERGEFACHVSEVDSDGSEGATLWQADTALADELVEDGFIKNRSDASEWDAYLNAQRVICGDLLTDLDEVENETAEVYEWWLVSSWLANRLKTLNEVVLDNGYGTWWGRQGTGQAILLDGLFQGLLVNHMGWTEEPAVEVRHV